MLARQKKGLDVAGGSSGRLPHGRTEKQPADFMFIDSSNGGVNAKPDKVVRSFVMKNARNKKPWSTKPRNPVEVSKGEAPRQRRSPFQSQASNSYPASIGALPRLDCNNYAKPLDQQMIASPCSSRCNSVFSSHSSNRSYESPVSSYASPRAEIEYDRAEDAYDYHNSRLKAFARQSSFNIGFAKSFNCLAIPLNAYDESLLHRFIAAIIPRLLPLDLFKSSEAAATDWVATCVQSPIGAPFIYAALTTVTRSANLESNTYKWRAIADLNKFLADPSKSTDDTTIATVLILLALEEAELADPRKTGSDRQNSININDVHRSGLQTMIRQRGGLAALGSNQCLQVFILMHSIAQSITTFNRPYAILCDNDGRVEDYITTSIQPARSLTHVLRQFHDLGIRHSLFSIVSTITIFISDLSGWYETGTSLASPLNLQKHTCLLLYRLFHWCDRNPESEGNHVSLDRSICLALLIFMVIATEPDTPSFGSRLSKAVTKLYISLQKVPASRWSNSPSLLLWTVTMGAIGAEGLPGSPRSRNSGSMISFFAQYSRLVYAEFEPRPTTSEHMLERMKTCLWIPSMFDDSAKRQWSLMELCRAGVLDADWPSTSSEGERDHVVDDEYALGQSTTMRFFAEEGRMRCNEVRTK